MKPKAVMLSAIVVDAIVSGALVPFTHSGPGPGIAIWVLTVVSTSLVFGWYHLDAAERSYRRSRWLDIGIAGFALLAMPYYFFRSRGAAGGLVSTLLFLLMLPVVAIGSYVGVIATALVMHA